MRDLRRILLSVGVLLAAQAGIVGLAGEARAASCKFYVSSVVFKENTLVVVVSSNPACISVVNPQPIAVLQGRALYKLCCEDETCSSLITISGTEPEGNPASSSNTKRCVKSGTQLGIGSNCETDECILGGFTEGCRISDSSDCAGLEPGECLTCSAVLAVPAVPEWGLIILPLLLVTAGTITIWRWRIARR